MLTEQQQASMKKQDQISAQQQQQIKLQAEALENNRAQQAITAKQVILFSKLFIISLELYVINILQNMVLPRDKHLLVIYEIFYWGHLYFNIT